MSVLFLFLIRKGLRLKRVPRFTKIIVCPQMLLYCFSPPSLPHGSLPPPSPFNFCYLVFPCSCSLDVSAQRGREPLGGGATSIAPATSATPWLPCTPDCCWPQVQCPSSGFTPSADAGVCKTCFSDARGHAAGPSPAVIFPIKPHWFYLVGAEGTYWISVKCQGCKIIYSCTSHKGRTEKGLKIKSVLLLCCGIVIAAV